MGGDARKLPNFCKKNQVQPVRPVKPGRPGDRCDASTKCGRRAPVCNYDEGSYGYCERCPRDCMSEGYHTQKGQDTCCEMCSNANSYCSFATTDSYAEFIPATGSYDRPQNVDGSGYGWNY